MMSTRYVVTYLKGLLADVHLILSTSLPTNQNLEDCKSNQLHKEGLIVVLDASSLSTNVQTPNLIYAVDSQRV